MKAAPMMTKPDFCLMTQKDILAFYHLQMPRWLFFDSRYKHLSLEAKVIYSFLLNRFQLSRLNNWINSDGEIFIIYTRNSLSEEIGISYRKAISGIKELVDARLIWERRCGRGDANQIYLACVDANEEDALKHRSAPFEDSRPADSALLETDSVDAISDDDSIQGAAAPIQDLPDLQVKDCKSGTSRAAYSVGQDVPKPQSSYIYKNYTEPSDIDSQSVSDNLDGLERVLEGCDLWMFSPETAKVFESAIERLWFTTGYKIGKAVLPQSKVRSHLYELDGIRLQEVERKISANTERSIKNTTAYVMAVIFNTIWEVESDVMADPYLNSLRRDVERGSS